MLLASSKFVCVNFGCGHKITNTKKLRRVVLKTYPDKKKADGRATPGTARLSVAEPEVRVLDAAKQQLG